MSEGSVGSLETLEVLTAAYRVRVVARAVLFGADVTKRAGAKGDHRERWSEWSEAVWKEGRSLSTGSYKRLRGLYKPREGRKG